MSDYLTIGERLDKELSPDQKEYCKSHGIDWLRAHRVTYAVGGSGSYVKRIDDHFMYQPEQIHLHSIIADIEPFESPASGKMITSRSKMRDDLAQTGCREFEGCAVEKQEAARQQQYQYEKEDRSAHESAARAFYQLDPKKREILRRGE